jgi:hypothetical protein
LFIRFPFRAFQETFQLHKTPGKFLKAFSLNFVFVYFWIMSL